MDREPLVSDERLEAVADVIRHRFPGLPDDTKFVTFIQPAKQSLDGKVKVAAMACMAIISPKPRHLLVASKYRDEIMTTGTMLLERWRQEEKDAGHYAGAPDHLMLFYFPIAQQHMAKLADMQQMLPAGTKV